MSYFKLKKSQEAHNQCQLYDVDDDNDDDDRAIFTF